MIESDANLKRRMRSLDESKITSFEEKRRFVEDCHGAAVGLGLRAFFLADVDLSFA